jgi:hypothetical protein
MYIIYIGAIAAGAPDLSYSFAHILYLIYYTYWRQGCWDLNPKLLTDTN